MSLHWIHVTISYALALAGFGGFALGAFLRHRAATRRLARLEAGARGASAARRPRPAPATVLGETRP